MDIKKKYPGLGWGLGIFCLLWTLSSPWTHLYYPILFEVLFAGIELVSLYIAATGVTASKHQGVKKIFFAQCFFGVSAAILWVIDNIACKQILASPYGQSAFYPYFGSLHGWWHVLMAFHVCSGLCILCFFTEDVQRRDPEFKWKGLLLPIIVPKKKES